MNYILGTGRVLAEVEGLKKLYIVIRASFL